MFRRTTFSVIVCVRVRERNRERKRRRLGAGAFSRIEGSVSPFIRKNCRSSHQLDKWNRPVVIGGTALFSQAEGIS